VLLVTGNHLLDKNRSRLDTLRTLPKARCLRHTGPTKLNGKENLMPKVGNKHYAYTKKGMAKAKAAAKKSGKKMTNAKKK
jgi:hypothetical protein